MVDVSRAPVLVNAQIVDLRALGLLLDTCYEVVESFDVAGLGRAGTDLGLSIERLRSVLLSLYGKSETPHV